VSPAVPTSHFSGALAPAKLRKDGIRLGIVAVVSIVYAVTFEQPVLDVLLIGLNGFGVLVGLLALGFVAVGIRQHGRAAVVALAVYGACTAAHLLAIFLLLRH
jgi:hypothetical protein